MNELQQAILVVLQARSGHKHFGRTKLMKHVYFLSQVAGTEIGVNFELFTWGPFSKEVLEERERLIGLGLIDEEPPEEEGKSYSIWVVEPSKVREASEKEEAVLKHLDGLSAKDLEGMSTIHFVHQSINANKNEVVQTVKNLKPYFDVKELEEYWDKLSSWSWID